MASKWPLFALVDFFLLLVVMDTRELMNALTIKVHRLSGKTIGVEDLKLNGIKPVVLNEVGSNTTEDVHHDEEEKNRILQELGIGKKIETPSIKTLEAILALDVADRPQGWSDISCKDAISLQALIQTENSRFPHLVQVDYVGDLRNIISPRLLGLLFRIAVHWEWVKWPSEDLARQIIYELVGDDSNRLWIPAKKSSSDFTFRFVSESQFTTSGCNSRYYTPQPDTQVAWFEVDSEATRADKYRMLLSMNSMARCLHLVPDRRDAILLVSVFIDHELSTSEITIFMIPPSGPIQTLCYESSSGRDGAAEFLHVMHKVLGRIGDSSESQQTPFITLYMHIDRVKDDIKAAADGALTLSAEIPEDEGSDGGKFGEDDTTLILHSESDSSSLGIITRNHGPPGSPQI
ncbi:hypothetical protein V5O48_017215 [Marasmius crinis-equi]|uniref:Uncharacterized protein n=1 Tax=Marasmius crinis-equi TaxID=585013 RepID=A0ABR3EPM0_9AGAR